MAEETLLPEGETTWKSALPIDVRQVVKRNAHKGTTMVTAFVHFRLDEKPIAELSVEFALLAERLAAANPVELRREIEMATIVYLKRLVTEAHDRRRD